MSGKAVSQYIGGNFSILAFLDALSIIAAILLSLLLQIDRHVREQIENNVRGIDMVVGAKGSPLQLILSSVYHISDHR